MEYLGIYDENGVYMSKKIARGDKSLAENEYIKLAVVWLKCKGKYLIQKSSAQKGSDYAVSGGHVPDGITSQEQASVELEEELGLKVQEENLTFVGNIKLPVIVFGIVNSMFPKSSVVSRCPHFSIISFSDSVIIFGILLILLNHSHSLFLRRSRIKIHFCDTFSPDNTQY